MKNYGKFPNLLRFHSTWIKPQGYDTGIKVYNCIVKEKVPLITKHKGIINWYTCGPTVYDDAHIGHASCYLKVDILQRILSRYFNFNIISAMNITDIDDKIIKKAKELNKPYKDVSEFYEHKFWLDLSKLKITKPNIVLKVTENITDIIEFINKLICNGSAYVKDGSVLFKIGSYPYYGKLVHFRKINGDGDSGKEEIPDCVLWKSSNSEETSWNSPWGNGRPGWHVECSTLASKFFGSSIDIHAGGMDLKFPHHENEEAHSCAYHSISQWVNYWVHIGQLHCQSSDKMSKSLKNTISVSSLLKNTEADVFRFACLMTHYQSRMEYNDASLKMAGNVLKKYKNFLDSCDNYCLKQNSSVLDDENVKYLLLESRENIHEAFCDDFNTPEVVNILNKIVKITNPLMKTQNISIPTVIGLRNFMHQCLDLFKINLDSSVENINRSENVEVLDILKNFRLKMREIGISTRNEEIFRHCDEVRHLLKNKGIDIKDVDVNKVSKK